MTTPEIPNHDKQWVALPKEDQITCIRIAISEWSTGLTEEAMKRMLINMELVNKLQSTGIVEAKQEWILHQELADQLKDEVERIKKEKLITGYTVEESRLCEKFSKYTRIANEKNEKLRYRFVSESFHNYVFDKHRHEDDE